MADEIIQEVWQSKDQLARKFNYDICALGAELQKRQIGSKRAVVNLAKEAAGQPKDRAERNSQTD